MDVSIIIVSFNTSKMLKDCIESIYKYTKDISFEIIVSDNNSKDDSVSMLESNFPEVIIVKNEKNLGFGAANNRGRSLAKGKYVFYLNSDTLLLNNAVKIFFDYFENHSSEKIGALGCNMTGPDGNIVGSWSSNFSFKHDVLRFIYEYSLLFCFWKKEIRNKKKVFDFYEGDVDVIIGADLFMPNNDFAAFDEYFFLYHEETDLQLRLQEAGLSRKIIKGPEIVHLEGGSKQSVIKKYDHFISFSKINDRLSRVKFYKKNSNRKYQYKILKFLVYLIWTFPSIKKFTKNYLSELKEI